MRQTHDTTRLPQWAQVEIARLEMRLDEANKRNQSIEAGETNTRVNQWGLAKDIYLPDGAHITFSLDAHRTIDCSVRDGLLHISGGADCLIITPVVSNVIDLTTTR